MYTRNTAAAYQAASFDTDSHIGLLIVVYQALAQQLHRTGEAIERGRISDRCDASNRALALVGHLESWTVHVEDTTVRASLTSFYSWLRGQILAVQTTRVRDQADSLAEVVLRLRATWQVKQEELLRNSANLQMNTERQDVLRVSPHWSA